MPGGRDLHPDFPLLYPTFAASSLDYVPAAPLPLWGPFALHERQPLSLRSQHVAPQHSCRQHAFTVIFIISVHLYSYVLENANSHEDRGLRSPQNWGHR